MHGDYLSDGLRPKRRWWYVGFGFGAVIVVVAAYFICFPYLTPRNTTIRRADLIAVFPGGGPGRKQAAYKLLKQGYADRIVITSGNENSVQQSIKKAGPIDLLKNVSCGKARSTFEDALFAGGVAKTNGYNSIILVTGAYHLPRASFLLRSVLKNQGVTVYPCGISLEQERTGSQKSDARGQRADDGSQSADYGDFRRLGTEELTEWKMLFDERIKFLGSLVEMGIYRISGILINDYGWVRRMKKAMKDIILFEKHAAGGRPL